MDQNPMIVFVCEHGAAKSIVAAAYFNQFAKERGLHVRAVARGTNPDSELSSQAIKGLHNDGLTPTESTPQKLTLADMQTARQIITFCELPAKYQQQILVERWEDVPPVSENYKRARDVIIEHIKRFLDQ